MTEQEYTERVEKLVFVAYADELINGELCCLSGVTL